MADGTDRIKASLSGVGSGPWSHRSALLTSDLSGAGLGDAGFAAIASFPHLQEVLAAGNGLSDASPLGALRSLRRVDLSENKIEDPLAFDVDEAKGDGESEDVDARGLATSVGSSLEVATAKACGCRRMPSVGRHPLLQELVLDDNEIDDIGAALAGASSLQTLSLQGNALSRVSGLDGLMLEVLKLNSNRITRLVGLNRLPWLRRLELRGNSIKFLGPNLLSQAASLTHLDLRDNEIDDVAQLSYLEPCGRLQSLDLRGNPVASSGDENYRLRALYRLSQLESFDGEAVASEDKVAAVNLYGADVAARRTAFSEELPEVPFMNTMPPLEDASLDNFTGPLFVGGMKLGGRHVVVTIRSSRDATRLGWYSVAVHSASKDGTEAALDVPATVVRSGGPWSHEHAAAAVATPRSPRPVEMAEAAAAANDTRATAGIPMADLCPKETAAELAMRLNLEFSKGGKEMSIFVRPTITYQRSHGSAAE